MRSIEGNIGSVLRLALCTSQLTNTTAALACVELDLLKARPESVWIGIEDGESFRQPIKYLKIPAFCTSCKTVGHEASVCRKNPKSAPTTSKKTTEQATARAPIPNQNSMPTGSQKTSEGRWVVKNPTARQATSRSAGYHKVIPQEVIPVSNTVARLSSDLFQGDDQALKDTAAAKEGREIALKHLQIFQKGADKDTTIMVREEEATPTAIVHASPKAVTITTADMPLEKSSSEDGHPDQQHVAHSNEVQITTITDPMSDASLPIHTSQLVTHEGGSEARPAALRKKQTQAIGELETTGSVSRVFNSLHLEGAAPSSKVDITERGRKLALIDMRRLRGPYHGKMLST